MSEDPKVFRIGSVQNAMVTGKRFKARLIEAGLISYTDVKQGVALVKKTTIDRCINSFVGTPITLKHKTVTNATKQKEIDSNGVIESVSFNAEDGWFWCEGSVNGQDARARINSVGKVSCGYNITSLGPRGIYNCIPYDYEITGFEGEHLAIEEKPRYAEATIRLNSKQSQPNQSNTMFKWFPKKPAAAANTNAEADAAALKLKQEQDAAAETARLNAEAAASGTEEISGDTEIMVGEEKVKLTDLTAAYKAHKENAISTEGQLPEGASLDVDGVAVPVADLIAAHKLTVQNAARREAQPTVYKIVNARAEADVPAKPASLDMDTQESRLARGRAQY